MFPLKEVLKLTAPFYAHEFMEGVYVSSKLFQVAFGRMLVRYCPILDCSHSAEEMRGR